MAKPKKDHLEVFSVRLSRHEKDNLKLLAIWHRKQSSTVIRDLINQAAEQLRGQA